MEEKGGISVSTPVAIVIAGVCIALAIMYVGKSDTPAAAVNLPIEAPRAEVRPVSAEDHLYGSRDAAITIIEYSDFECPFCERVHTTLQNIVNESGGKISWAYRHFPLTSIHQNALPAANASECVAQLKGDEAFWAFASMIFGAQSPLGDATYVSVAKTLGIAEPDMRACMLAKPYESRIKADFDEVLQAGGEGTPYMVVVRKDGVSAAFSGALPKESIEQIVASLQKR